MIAKLFLFAAIIAAGSTAASAEGIGGHYSVKGTLADGMKYSISAEIVMKSETTCDIKWSDGTEGVCMLHGTTLSVASITHGKPQVGVYQVAPDGSIEGEFIDNFHRKGISREKLTPVQ